MKSYKSASLYSHVFLIAPRPYPLQSSSPSDRPNVCQKVFRLVAAQDWTSKAPVRGLAPTQLVVFRQEAILFPEIRLETGSRWQ